MSRHTSNESGGSDGTWFLEAVGAKDTAPSQIEAVEQLGSENLAPEDSSAAEAEPTPGADTPGRASVQAVTFDGDPGTSTSSFHPVPAIPPPPDLEHPADDSSAPPHEPPPPVPDDALSAPLRSRRNFRWPIVAVLLIAIVGVVVAAFVLPRAVEDEALVVRQSYYDAAADLRNYLPTAQAGLDAVTNPASTSDQVSGAVPIVAELDTKAFALESVTAEPLPSVLPLVPSGAIDALEPLQVRGSVLGMTGSLLATRIGSAYVYRTSVPTLLDAGELPTNASTQQVNEISVRLASSLAADAGVVADLPDDPSFAATRSAATAAVERYGPWQDAYLAALTAEDTEAAGTLVDELQDVRDELATVLQTDLLAFRSDADADLVELAAELERYLNDLTRAE